MTESSIENRADKIENFLHKELGYKPSIETPDTDSNVWRVLNSLHKTIKGKDNIMGIETKVKIMWWVNYIIGFGLGFGCQSLIQVLVK